MRDYHCICDQCSAELYLFLWICVFVFVSSGQISATAVANMKITQHGGTLDCICAGLKYVISSVDSMELQVKSHSNARITSGGKGWESAGILLLRLAYDQQEQA